MLLAATAADVAAVVLALLAAMTYPAGSAAQQKAHLRDLLADRDAGVAAATVGVLRQWIWWAGIALGFVGVIMQAGASALAPLVLVAPVLALQLVFLVPASAWVVGTGMEGREWFAAALTTVGLAATLVALQPQEGVDLGRTGDWLEAAAVCAVLFAVFWIASLSDSPYKAALRGTAAGVHAGVVGAVIKQAVEAPNLGNWAVWAMAVLGVMNVVWINSALRVGRLATGMTMIVVWGTIVTSGIGLWVFREELALTPLLGFVAVLALTAVGIGIALLAKSPSLLALEETTAEAEAEATATAKPSH